MKVEEFEIIVHQSERTIEVKYPARPTLEAFLRYDKAIRAAITKMGPPWDCLVDQSRVQALSPELAPRVADLNAWAVTKGMEHTARVLSSSAIGELQGERILREAGVKKIGSLHKDRETAWKHLRSLR
ncbi:MAG: hypothetical protein JNM17_26035 [Archangium sp.]|nr:hypothetical protein [Archangium sp.]